MFSMYFIYLLIHCIIMFLAPTRQNLGHVRHLRRILRTVDLLGVNRRIPHGTFFAVFANYD